MTTAEALEILKSGNGLESRQFAVLQAIAREVTADPDARMSKELVLRAMEQRGDFTQTEEKSCWPWYARSGFIPI